MRADYSFYEVLGIDRTASQGRIRAAYYAAIKQFHPDVDSGPDAHDTTIALIDAYAVLGNPESRRCYDLQFTDWEKPLADADLQTAAERSPEPERATAVLFHLSRSADKPAAEIDDAPAEPDRRFWRSLGLTVWSALTAQSRFSNPVAGAAAVTLVLAIITGMMTVVFLTQRSSLDGASASTPFMAVAAQTRTMMAPCLDERRAVNAEILYEHCVQARVKLHQLMTNAGDPAHMEEYKLQDALAEMRQAVGAAELNMSSTTGFVHESVASFADIRKSAKTTRVRRLAEIYYNCYALKRCPR